VAVTGGIGAGKSTVCAAFAGHGVPVIDADELARAAVARGQPALAEIAARFGPGVLQNDGSLDRAALRRIVFADAAARRRLEAIVHPRVRAATVRAVARCPAPYLLLAIPLLLETGACRNLVDRILVVDCAPETQIRRVMQRDHLTRGEVEAIMRSQVSREQRLAAADDVVDNNGPPEAIAGPVAELHRRYLGLATGRA
jgi:dephospho-CoA kinase